MIKERISEEQIELARRADVLALVGNRVELKRESRGEYAGPCPRCGGQDRFHCTAEWFMCRQCHEKRGDAIGLLRWLTPGLSFAEAVAQLAGGAAPTATGRGPAAPRPAAKPQAAQPAEWRNRAAKLVLECQKRLLEPEGEAGAEYLLSRELEPRTWLAYGLGFRPDAPVPGTQGKQGAPAIVLPWYAGDRLVAVRYRFLEAQGGHKLTAETGSQFAGRLFGGQALPTWVRLPADDGRRNGERLCTLLIVEGEINAMSAWQAAGDTGLHVLSLGSESAGLSEAAVQAALRYGLVLAWADKGKIAQRLMAQLPGAVGVQSPGGNDANDLHRRGLLGGFLARKRAAEAMSREELEGLLWALYDAAQLPAGIDGGTAAALQGLARQLGKQAAIYEAEPGRWITVDHGGPGGVWRE
jgi:hypothetical protein